MLTLRWTFRKAIELSESETAGFIVAVAISGLDSYYPPCFLFFVSNGHAFNDWELPVQFDAEARAHAARPFIIFISPYQSFVPASWFVALVVSLVVVLLTHTHFFFRSLNPIYFRSLRKKGKVYS